MVWVILGDSGSMYKAYRIPINLNEYVGIWLTINESFIRLASSIPYDQSVSFENRKL